MKKTIIIALIIVSILIIAFYASWMFRNDLLSGLPDNLITHNTSCETDADCISTCSCSCINKNEYCGSDEFTDCSRESYEQFNCQCINNVCQNVDGKKAYTKPVASIDINSLQEEEIIDVRCWQCEGCGCDVHLLRTDEKVGQASYKETYKCLEDLPKVEQEFYKHEVQKNQFIELKNCLNN